MKNLPKFGLEVLWISTLALIDKVTRPASINNFMSFWLMSSFVLSTTWSKYKFSTLLVNLVDYQHGWSLNCLRKNISPTWKVTGNLHHFFTVNPALCCFNLNLFAIRIIVNVSHMSWQLPIVFHSSCLDIFIIVFLFSWSSC